jgi:hypothetical protein
VIEIDDPAGVAPGATSTLLAPPPGATGTDGPSAWQAPERPKLTLFADVRSDVAGKMYARRQIDRAMSAAARTYAQKRGGPTSGHHHVNNGRRACTRLFRIPPRPRHFGTRPHVLGGLGH